MSARAASVDLGALTLVEQMRGEDAEETELLHAALTDARAYLGSFSWCRAIREAHFGCGVGGVVAIFLFGIDAAPGADEWLWVVSGDRPSAYLVIERAPDPLSALSVYCELMDAWVAAAHGAGELADVFPVRAVPTEENAAALARRIELLRSDVIPALRR